MHAPTLEGEGGTSVLSTFVGSGCGVIDSVFAGTSKFSRGEGGSCGSCISADFASLSGLFLVGVGGCDKTLALPASDFFGDCTACKGTARCVIHEYSMGAAGNNTVDVCLFAAMQQLYY